MQYLPLYSIHLSVSFDEVNVVYKTKKIAFSFIRLDSVFSAHNNYKNGPACLPIAVYPEARFTYLDGLGRPVQTENESDSARKVL